jgi:hypothetical protein
MERPEQPSPTSSGSQPKQGKAAHILGCISTGCAILGIILFVPFLGMEYGDWWSGGSGFDDGMQQILGPFLFICGSAVLAIGVILGGAGVVALRLCSATWSEACSRSEFASLIVCAVFLVIGALLVSLGWHQWLW